MHFIKPRAALPFVLFSLFFLHLKCSDQWVKIGTPLIIIATTLSSQQHSLGATMDKTARDYIYISRNVAESEGE
jgi:hypothetical protein